MSSLHGAARFVHELNNNPMSNTTYMNIFPARPRLRPSDVARLAQAGSGDLGAAAKTNNNSPFSERRVERAFELMGRWHSEASTEDSVELSSLAL